MAAVEAGRGGRVVSAHDVLASRDCAFPSCPEPAVGAGPFCGRHAGRVGSALEVVQPDQRGVGAALLAERLEHAKLALTEAVALADVKAVMDQASVAEAIAKAHASREAHLFAGEVRLWAERRVGEIRAATPRIHGIAPRFDRQEAKRLREQGLTHRQVGARLGVDKSAIGYAEQAGWKGGQPGVKVSDLDREFGVHSGIAKRWERLAAIPEPEFVRLLEEAKERDVPLTALRILQRHGNRIEQYESRVAPGVYRRPDGTHVVKVKENYEVAGSFETAERRAAELEVRLPKRVRGRSNTIHDLLSLLERAAALAADLAGMDLSDEQRVLLARTEAAAAWALAGARELRESIARTRAAE